MQRLQDEVYQAGTEVSRLQDIEWPEAGRLQDELDDLREEVDLSEGEAAQGRLASSAREYTDVRSQLQDLRSRARGDAPSHGIDRVAIRLGLGTSTSGSSRRRRPRRGAAAGTGFRRQAAADRFRAAVGPAGVERGARIPVGQEIDVRIQSELTSDTAQVEDRFEATTLVDSDQGERVLIPAGSVMRGIVTSVNRASRTDRKGSLTVAFNQVTVNGRNYPMRGTVIAGASRASGIRGEAGRDRRRRGGRRDHRRHHRRREGSADRRPGRRRRHDGRHRRQGRPPAAGTVLRVRMDTPRRDLRE